MTKFNFITLCLALFDMTTWSLF